MGINHRLNLFHAYFSHDRDFECSWKDLVGKIILPPCAVIAKSYIVKMEEDGAYKKIYLRNIKKPLYWPQTIPLHNLYMIISELSYKKNWHYYEVPETRVKTGDVVLDCGAAEGLFSLRIMERAQCVIIEPSPVFVESLEKTFHNESSVQIIPYALSNEEGRANLCSGLLNATIDITMKESLESSLSVKTITIDKMVKDLGLMKVDYIKGDLESFEMKVLQGGEQTIREFKPKIALTTYHQGNNWKEIRDFVLSVVPDYAWRVKGLSYLNRLPKPVMIHFWPT